MPASCWRLHCMCICTLKQLRTHPLGKRHGSYASPFHDLSTRFSEITYRLPWFISNSRIVLIR